MTTTTDDLAMLADEWSTSLEAANRSPRTVQVYLASLSALRDFLAATGRPTGTQAIRTTDVEAWLANLRATGASPATVSIRYRSVRGFWTWAIRRSIVTTNPTDAIAAPKVPVQPPPIISEAEFQQLLGSIHGHDFLAIRDRAILRLFWDTGCRLSELAGLAPEDVEPTHRRILVHGKGGRDRTSWYTARTAEALLAYRRVRAGHRLADLPDWWLGNKTRLTPSGVAQLVRERGRAAGLTVHPHLFRHAWAHRQLVAGMAEHDVATLAGWTSLKMLGRYGASAATDRARDAYRRLNPG